MIKWVHTCYRCDSIMNPTEVLYSELFECCVQVYHCPCCGADDEDTLE